MGIENIQENIEKPKIEWGPELGRMSWDRAQIEITELNSGLKDGEKPWRLPTKDELLAEFNKTNSMPEGFGGGYYLSSSVHPFESPDAVYQLYMTNGRIGSIYKNEIDGSARLVRDIE